MGGVVLHGALGPTVALLAFAAQVAPALATSKGCPRFVEAWVARAADETDTDLRVVSCLPGLVRVELTTTPPGPILIEVLPSGRPAFRKAGLYGLQPVLNIPDFKQVPLQWRDAFARFSEWVAERGGEELLPPALDAEPVTNQPPPSPTIPWRLVVALVVACACLVPQSWRSDVAGRSFGRGLLGLGLVGFALRAAAGRWDTVRGEGLGPLWVAYLFGDSKHVVLDRVGYWEIFSWIGPLAGPYLETTLFAVNCVLSAATPVVTAAAIAAAGAPRWSALLAGLCLALDPVSIYAAPSELYFIPVELGVALVAWLALEACRLAPTGGKVRPSLQFVAAALVVDQTARIHPAAWAPLALAPLVPFASGHLRLRSAIGLTLGGALLYAVTLGVSSWPLLAAALHEVSRRTQLVDPREVVLPLMLVLVLLAAASARRQSRRALAWAAPSLVAAIVYAQVGYPEMPLLQSRVHRLAGLPLLLLAAWSIPPTWARRKASVAVLVAGLAANLFVSWPRYAEHEADVAQNRFVRETLAALPDDCMLMHVHRIGNESELHLPVYHTRSFGESLRGVHVPPGRGSLSSYGRQFECSYYLRGSICATPMGRAVCRDIESGAQMRSVASRSVPEHEPVATIELFELTSGLGGPAE